MTSQGDCTTGECTPLQATVKAPGDRPASVCLGAKDVSYDVIYSLVSQATRTVDISSNRQYAGRNLVALQNALAYLEATQRGGAVEVRVLTGARDPRHAPDPSPQEFVDRLTRSAGSALRNIRVSVGTYGGAPFSWSHSKMILVDGRTALVGGIELGMPDYQLPHFVMNDLSMRLSGGAAATATRYFDFLFRYARTSGSVATSPASAPRTAQAAEERPRSEREALLPGGVTVISAGSTGGIGVNPFTDASGDEALFALIDAASSSLRLSQQDLVSVSLGGDQHRHRLSPPATWGPIFNGITGVQVPTR